MIKLVKNTITKKELNDLCDWIKTDPRLTKSDQTNFFEIEWSNYLKRKYSLFVTSGSSANLISFYSLLISEKLKNKKVILPAVSWSTTVAPAIQFGYEPILCDCNLVNFGLDLNHLKELIKIHDPGLIVTCNVLGFANDYKEILHLCKKNNIFVIEDSCEAIGTVYKGKQTGTFGDISTFSFYYGHHMSTIEGGMVTTDNKDLYNILKSIRCHGWDRDLDEATQNKLRKKYKIDDFKSLYTFYHPGFNVRSTDLQAFLGRGQLKRLNSMNNKRHNNFIYFQSKDTSNWNLDIQNYSLISNMAYPVISKDIERIKKNLSDNNI